MNKLYSPDWRQMMAAHPAWFGHSFLPIDIDGATDCKVCTGGAS